MTAELSALDEAILETERLRRLLRRNKDRPQVRSSDERSSAKATALAWFHTHRPVIAAVLMDTDLGEADKHYQAILGSSDRAGARSRYFSALAEIKSELIRLRAQTLTTPSTTTHTSDRPPDFSPLISDAAMRKIIHARWNECTRCLSADAPLAATVMMGGLLEALLLARINAEPDKQPIFKARAAPKDRNGKTKPLQDWMLKSYIDVVHELRWISVSAKDVGEVLRDYRNYIHPYKELSHGVRLTIEDASLLWEISKSISRQIINSIE